MSTENYKASTAIGTVFARELRENLLRKSSLITLAIMVVAVVGGIVFADYMVNKDSDKTVTVAVVGEAPFAEATAEITSQLDDADSGAAVPLAGAGLSKVEITSAADVEAARTAVTEGDADAALVPDTSGGKEGSWTLLDDDSPTWLAGLLQDSLQKQTEAAILAENGIDAGDFYAESQSATVTVESVNAEEDAKLPAVVVTLAAIMVMMTAILVFGGSVASSVIEEKSSRVIEIILSTVKPLHLLTGKILGAAMAGIIMMTALVGCAAVTMAVTGFGSSMDIPWSAIWLMIPCFLLGYLFFASLYAAAGSLVSRMEDFQSAQMPVMILAMLTMYVPLFGWNALDSIYMKVATWVPPVSVATAPLQYAAGNLSTLGLIGTAALMALSVVAVVALAAWIYPRNVLRTGAAVSWKKALTGS